MIYSMVVIISLFERDDDDVIMVELNLNASCWCSSNIVILLLALVDVGYHTLIPSYVFRLLEWIVLWESSIYDRYLIWHRLQILQSLNSTSKALLSDDDVLLIKSFDTSKRIKKLIEIIFQNVVIRNNIFEWTSVIPEMLGLESIKEKDITSLYQCVQFGRTDLFIKYLTSPPATILHTSSYNYANKGCDVTCLFGEPNNINDHQIYQSSLLEDIITTDYKEFISQTPIGYLIDEKPILYNVLRLATKTNNVKVVECILQEYKRLKSRYQVLEKKEDHFGELKNHLTKRLINNWIYKTIDPISAEMIKMIMKEIGLDKNIDLTTTLHFYQSALNSGDLELMVQIYPHKKIADNFYRPHIPLTDQVFINSFSKSEDYLDPILLQHCKDRMGPQMTNLESLETIFRNFKRFGKDKSKGGIEFLVDLCGIIQNLRPNVYNEVQQYMYKYWTILARFANHSVLTGIKHTKDDGFYGIVAATANNTDYLRYCIENGQTDPSIFDKAIREGSIESAEYLLQALSINYCTSIHSSLVSVELIEKIYQHPSIQSNVFRVLLKDVVNVKSQQKKIEILQYLMQLLVNQRKELKLQKDQLKQQQKGGKSNNNNQNNSNKPIKRIMIDFEIGIVESIIQNDRESFELLMEYFKILNPTITPTIKELPFKPFLLQTDYQFQQLVCNQFQSNMKLDITDFEFQGYKQDVSLCDQIKESMELFSSFGLLNGLNQKDEPLDKKLLLVQLFILGGNDPQMWNHIEVFESLQSFWFIILSLAIEYKRTDLFVQFCQKAKTINPRFIWVAPVFRHNNIKYVQSLVEKFKEKDEFVDSDVENALFTIGAHNIINPTSIAITEHILDHYPNPNISKLYYLGMSIGNLIKNKYFQLVLKIYNTLHLESSFISNHITNQSGEHLLMVNYLLFLNQKLNGKNNCNNNNNNMVIIVK
ncbi:hypothetical protein DFA_02406 [Cavenderia fasciculata]|uniref:Uncharacterized protein n=1 Tax=Cavenderia fasciculata TaxID=261658 RepID=F4PZD0_CACFS|nr:uncharacterized protein DFA_02406 [Cavenderia fasciculata]EGG19159.1 hypothetical protein DFA_02406 [Cavenderia fasciculata]|eukprot:XP_004366792.1 hypothetical protein DFA_02406 [Cavenderia fasciculata]